MCALIKLCVNNNLKTRSGYGLLKKRSTTIIMKLPGNRPNQIKINPINETDKSSFYFVQRMTVHDVGLSATAISPMCPSKRANERV